MTPQAEPAPPPPPPPRPIFIIKRKKAGHGGHHGGAWKVAYADFVTAMMALFIVLWLMSADEKVKQEISAFFNNPTGPGTQTGTAAAGAGNSIEMAKEDMSKLREKMEQALKTMPNFRDMKEHIEMTITVDGLRIELLETQAGMFFESGRPLPSATGAELLTRLAEELGKLPNNLLIEGHTDAKPFANTDGYYSNWELSTDRANSARRLMEGARSALRASRSGAGLRCAAIASSGRSGTRLQSQNFGDCAVSGSSRREAQGVRRRVQSGRRSAQDGA
jgi:chemotaxis protein MotB